MKFEFRGKPLTEEQIEILMKLTLSTHKDAPLGEDKNNIIHQNFISQIVTKRIEAYKLPFNLTEFFLLMSLSTWVTSPGRAMIMLAICQEYVANHDKKLLGIIEWVGIFPFGVPTDEEFDKMWDGQKVNGSNLVDDQNFFKLLGGEIPEVKI
jgi:hypothetical protein